MPSVSETRLTAAGSLDRVLRGRARRQPNDDERAAVDELFPVGAAFREYVWRFAALIVLSSSIAAFGLLADSGAVVIGAMLVAPLMTPITAVAASTVMARNDRLLQALAVIALGIMLAVSVGWVLGWIGGNGIVGSARVPGEISARTFPSLLDLGIAVSAGAAAGYILPRRSATGALPGVGIAVALVPPLVTVGITWEAGLGDDARNAFLLFLTNLAAIVFAASVMLLAAGFRPEREVGRRALAGRIGVTLLAVVMVALPLGVHTAAILRESRLQSDVVSAVETWDPTVRVVRLDVSIRSGIAEIDLLVSGQDPTQRVWRLAEDLRRRFGGPVELRLSYQQDRLYLVSAR
jgi:uncharacterized hydrophobic protein (TIGR00271 family)